MNSSRLVIVLLMLASMSVVAEVSGNLSGAYQFAGKTLVDPPEAEPQNTHLRLWLSDDMAKDLYDALDVAPVEDECLQDGSKTKFMGGTTCTAHVGGTFTCALAVNLKSQTVESIYAC